MNREQAEAIIKACNHDRGDWTGLVRAIETTQWPRLYQELVEKTKPYNLTSWETMPGRLVPKETRQSEGVT